MGASSGMYATAAAEPLATPALVPRRQFQKVKEASLHSKPRGSARFVRGTLQAGDAGLHWPRVLPTWSVAIGQRSAVHTERLGVQKGRMRSLRTVVAVLALLLLVAGTAFATR